MKRVVAFLLRWQSVLPFALIWAFINALNSMKGTLRQAPWLTINKIQAELIKRRSGRIDYFVCVTGCS